MMGFFMPTVLAPDISYCIAGGRVIFMSVRTGRFFALPRRPEIAFAAFAAGETLTLDDDVRTLLIAKGVLVEATSAISIAAPVEVEKIDVIWEPISPSPPSLALRAAAMAEQIKIDVFLRTRPFQKVVARFTKRKEGASSRDHDRSAYARIEAAIHAVDLILPPGNRCLVRSLAFMSLCLTRGFSPNLVIGVRSNPFRAHAWVQAGPHVVHDDLQQSQLFTPIFAI